jgi:hypothetical protein
VKRRRGATVAAKTTKTTKTTKTRERDRERVRILKNKKQTNKMAAKTYNKSATKGGSKRDKPPPLDQYIKPIIGIVLAVLGYHIFRGMIAKEILRVDLSSDGGTAVNELELREVLFGEDPSTGGNTNYAVLCYPENALYPISSVFQDSANDGTAPAQFRLLDCDIPMSFTEEKKTVMERFSKQLNSKTRPVVFVSGSIGSPKQVRLRYVELSLSVLFRIVLFRIVSYCVCCIVLWL